MKSQPSSSLTSPSTSPFLPYFAHFGHAVSSSKQALASGPLTQSRTPFPQVQLIKDCLLKVSAPMPGHQRKVPSPQPLQNTLTPLCPCAHTCLHPLVHKNHAPMHASTPGTVHPLLTPHFPAQPPAPGAGCNIPKFREKSGK